MHCPKCSWHQPAARVHIGIATGQVLCSQLADGINLTGSACRDGARIMEAAAPGEVWISQRVYGALCTAIDAEAVDHAAYSGLAGQSGVWCVRGFRGPGATDPPRPFVGRRSELRQLLGALELTAAIRVGHTVLLRGEAGIGKTRLLDQLDQLARERGFGCHKAQTLDFGVGASDTPIRPLLYSLLDIDLDAGSPQRQAALERARETGLLLQDDLVFINAAVDLTQPAELQRLYDAMDNEARQRGQRQAFVNVITRKSAQAPLLLMVEDIHWAAEDARQRLATLAVSARACPVLLALTTRTENDPSDASWRAAARGAVFSSIDLAPLSDAEATDMAATRCLDAAFVRSCVERAQGNPLFLDQLLRSADVQRSSLPASVHSIVLARMDQLAPHDRCAVEAAAVLGQRFSLPALRQVVEDATYSCSPLVCQGLIQSEGSEYRFVHALIQEAVYASVLRSRRRALHARAAQWFGERDPARQAEHLDAAGDPGAAAGYLRAARVDASQGALPRALRLCERIAAGVQLGPALRADVAARSAPARFGTSRHVDRCTSRRARAGIRWSRKAPCPARARCLRSHPRSASRGAGNTRAGRDRGGQGATPGELVQFHLLRGNLYFALGEIEACLASCERASALAAQAGSVELRASALGSLGDALYLAGRMLSAHEQYRRCVDLAHDEHLAQIRAAYLPMLGLTHLYRNDIPQCRRISEAALELARQLGAFRAEILAHSVLWDACLYAGEWQRAREHAECGVELARRVGARRFEAEAMFSLALALHALDVRHEPMALIDRAQAISNEVGPAFCGPWLCAVQAFVTKALGRDVEPWREEKDCLRAPCEPQPPAFLSMGHGGDAGAEGLGRSAALRSASRSYARAEPFPFAGLVIRRGRLLARWGSGLHDDETLGALRALRAEATDLGLMAAVPHLDAAIREPLASGR
jgi:tetratricopeptide (TPR) repeat protein